MTTITLKQARALGLDVPPESKYRSRKTVMDGVRFDSVREANRYAELRLLQRAGQISGLELQPLYVLQEGYRDASGKWVRPIIYKADFRYQQDGKTVVEDAKGFRTQAYGIKKKLFLAKWPEIDFREV